MANDPLLLPFEATFRGSNVTLRAWRDDDAPALHEAIAMSRDHLRRWMRFIDEHQTAEETRAYIVRSRAKWLLREDMNLGIWSPDLLRLYGGIGVMARDWAVPAFELGYWLRADAAGHGYVTAAAGLLTGYLLGAHHAQRVQIRCDARNLRSAAVPRRLGYALEGVLRQAERARDGTLEDTMIFARTPSA
ncbi:MAG: GNAT family N-acetyltransferase [Ktedonobacterales bacterium]